MFQDGALQRLISEDGLAGLTSNPAIFEKAIAKGAAYTRRDSAAETAGNDPGTALRTLDTGGYRGGGRPVSRPV